MIKEKDKEEPEVTILRRKEADSGEDSMKEKESGEREVVQSLNDKISEVILERTRVRKKKVAFKDEAEHLGLGQESGEWPTAEEDAEEEKLSGESEEWNEDSEKSSDDQSSLCGREDEAPRQRTTDGSLLRNIQLESAGSARG